MIYTKTATGVVTAKRSIMTGFTLAAGADAAKAVLHDNASAASGTVIGTITAPANGFSQVMFPCKVYAQNGIYATITGTSPTLTVYER